MRLRNVVCSPRGKSSVVCPLQVDSLTALVDDDGKLRDTASPDLKKARAKLTAAYNKVLRVVRSVPGELEEVGGRLCVNVLVDAGGARPQGLLVGNLHPNPALALCSGAEPGQTIGLGAEPGQTIGLGAEPGLTPNPNPYPQVGNSPGGGVLIEPMSAVSLNNAYQEARAKVADAEQAVCRLATGLVEEVRV